MKASVLKSYIREQILSDLSTPSVDEASEEEVENQKDLNKELEKTAQLKSQISEKNDSMDFPKELLSRNRDIIFRLVKVGSDRAKYELINKETGEPHELGFRFFQSVGELERDANNIIIPSGGTQSSQFESTLNEEEDEDAEADGGELAGFAGRILEVPKRENWALAPADGDLVAAPPGFMLGESM